MFEVIGLFFGAAVFFGLSAVLGAVSGVAAWLLFRRRMGLFRRVLLAVAVPPLCAVYMAACVVIFPGVSLFGDINEPLPNGYVLKALGKMPEYGEIEGKTTFDQPQMAGWIGKVDMEDRILFGTYSRLFTDQTFDPNPVLKPCCFAFDTSSKTVRNFDSLDQMNGFAGRPLKLVEVAYFRSEEPAYIRLRYIENVILLTPPSVLILGVWLFLFFWRRGAANAETM